VSTEMCCCRQVGISLEAVMMLPILGWTRRPHHPSAGVCLLLRFPPFRCKRVEKKEANADELGTKAEDWTVVANAV